MNFQDETDPFSMGNTSFSFNNFDPSAIKTDEAIIVVMAVDISPSIRDFESDLNNAFVEFIEEMQSSHVHDKLMVSIITFNETVKVLTGYQPIDMIDPKKFVFKNSGMSTALYDASLQAVENAFSYRETLESTGVTCKVLNFIITDGQDISSRNLPSVVKAKIDEIMSKEQNMNSFETILFGIGREKRSFEDSAREMGIKHCVTVGQSAKEIRKLIGFISASVSRSASNQAFTF